MWSRSPRVDDMLRAHAAHYPQPDPQWIEDRFRVWMHYAGTKIARGEWLDAHAMLGFMR